MFSLKRRKTGLITQLFITSCLIWPLTLTAATFRVQQSDDLSQRTETAIIVELHDNETAEDLIWLVTDSVLIESEIESRYILNEVTSLDDSRYADIVKARNNERDTASAVIVEGEIMLNMTRYAQLILFPAYVTASGQQVLSKGIEINMSKRHLENSELLDRESLGTSDVDRRWSSLATGIGTTEHAIVTSSALAESYQELADYRTATGIKSEVVLIEDILIEFSGRDEAEQLSEFCRQFYADGGQYILLGGDETVLPVRYTTASYVTELPELDRLQICDLYFADVDGEWDADNDGIWGERFGDLPDMEPDLMVGRLPFHTSEQIVNYINKLIVYETSPGNSNPDYLTNVFFFSSDQMRDYGTIGQHGYISEAFPSQFRIDTVAGVEHSAGSDISPTNRTAPELIPTLSDGYGIVNIIAHGRPDGFAVRTSGYNKWPKSYFITDDSSLIHGNFASLEKNNKVSLYYSLACDNTGFDQDQPPFVYRSENLATQLLAMPDAGAIGFVGYSRWGWVSSSHRQQKAFFEALTERPEAPAVAAMYASHRAVPYYRDLIYGQLFLGDPALRVYTDLPVTPAITVIGTPTGIQVAAVHDSLPVSDMIISVSSDKQLIATGITGVDGTIEFELDIIKAKQYTIAATNTMTTTVMTEFSTSLSTDIEDESFQMPAKFELQQNYPNPFNPTTTISFTLTERSDVDLSIFNILGQQIYQAQSGSMAAGEHNVIWDGRDALGREVASGAYFYRLRTDSFSSTKKMLLLR